MPDTDVLSRKRAVRSKNKSNKYLKLGVYIVALSRC